MKRTSAFELHVPHIVSVQWEALVGYSVEVVASCICLEWPSISWEDAARTAIETAAKSLRDLSIAEVGKLDMKIENGKVVAYRARVTLSFKYEA